MLKNKKKSKIKINNQTNFKVTNTNSKKTSFLNFKIALFLCLLLLAILVYFFISNFKLDNNLRITIFTGSLVLVGISFLMLILDKYVLQKINEFILYIKNSTIELRKVVWPERKTAFTLTIMVLVFVTILCVCIWSFDFLISKLLYSFILKRG